MERRLCNPAAHYSLTVVLMAHGVCFSQGSGVCFCFQSIWEELDYIIQIF